MKLFKKWGKWVNLSCGFHDEHYVLQGRRREDGKIQLRVEKSKKTYGVPKISIEELNNKLI